MSPQPAAPDVDVTAGGGDAPGQPRSRKRDPGPSVCHDEPFDNQPARSAAAAAACVAAKALEADAAADMLPLLNPTNKPEDAAQHGQNHAVGLVTYSIADAARMRMARAEKPAACVHSAPAKSMPKPPHSGLAQPADGVLPASECCPTSSAHPVGERAINEYDLQKDEEAIGKKRMRSAMAR